MQQEFLPLWAMPSRRTGHYNTKKQRGKSGRMVASRTGQEKYRVSDGGRSTLVRTLGSSDEKLNDRVLGKDQSYQDK